MPRRYVLCAILLVLAGEVPPTAQTAAAAGALEPSVGGGLALIDRSLVLLSSHRRLLVVGAHPDDEDNALLSHVSHGLGGDVAYLSLSRGEGGQNLIGPELGPELGIVRTGELLAARAFEHGRQYFTRAYDFGYTRSLDETFSRWPREILQRDAVRVARRFKPQVVVAVFPASGRAGHGQHQASAVIARDLFDMAGDGSAFPELSDEDLDPWTPEVLYRRAWGGQEATLTYSLDSLEPMTGRSLGQLAAASRSRHRSQDMGRIQRLGAFHGGLIRIAGGAGREATGVFDGVDTRLAAIAEPIADPATRERLARVLQDVEASARQIRLELTPARLESVVESLARLVRLLGEAVSIAESGGSRAVADLVSEKRLVASAALVAAAGVVLDARLDRETVALGGRAIVEAELWSTGSTAVDVTSVSVVGEAGWSVGSLVELGGEDGETGVQRWQTGIGVSSKAEPTMPYFLAQPTLGDLYDWEHVPPSVRGEPFAPPPLTAVFDLQLAGVPIHIEREVVYRRGDQAIGEIRRPLRAVPPVEIELASRLELWRRGQTAEAEIEVILRSNVDEPVAGRVIVETPTTWRVEGDAAFRIDRSRGSMARSLRARPVGLPEPGRYEIAVQVEIDGHLSRGSFPVLEYPHIRPRVAARRARLELSVFDMKLPDAGRVGYVRGASDRVPGVLSSLGVPVTLMSGEDLSLGDLDRFDVIIIGSRAYETDEELRNSNSRLLEYVERGGALVVQYQQYQFVDGGYAPFALEIGHPHGRVTDETAPVRVIDPESPVLRRPNAIGPADWEGWVQERGLYFPNSWDERYRPLLAMGDRGREEELGSLLVSEYGEGIYIYSGLSFFRQLPAGVPGAIRLFANLLASGPSRPEKEGVR